jgi:hypothetical protein
VVGNGREALDAVLRDAYDVVLMDIQMPEMDGVQAARAIVSAARRPRLAAHHRDDGQRDARRPRGLPGRRHGRLPRQADRAGDLATVLDHPATRSGHRGAGEEGVLDTARLDHLRSMQDASQPSLVRELIDMFETDSAAHVLRIAEAHAARRRRRAAQPGAPLPVGHAEHRRDTALGPVRNAGAPGQGPGSAGGLAPAAATGPRA